MPMKKDLKKAQKKLRYYESKHPGDAEGYTRLSVEVASLEKELKRQNLKMIVKEHKALQQKERDNMTDDEFLNQEFKKNNKKNIQKNTQKVQKQSQENRIKLHNMVVKKIMFERNRKIEEEHVKEFILHIDRVTSEPQ
jgi:hypothetical protein